MKEDKILTFKEVYQLKVFPVVVGPYEVNQFLGTNFSDEILCGFTKEDILQFEQQAKRDFNLENTSRIAPITLVFMPCEVPKRVLGMAVNVPSTLSVIASYLNIEIIFDEKSCNDRSIKANKNILYNQINKSQIKDNLAILSYIKPNPDYFGKNFEEQKILAKMRNEKILSLAEAFFVRIMMQIALSLNRHFFADSPESSLRVLTYFEKKPLLFYFDSICNFCFYPSENKKANVAVGKVAYLSRTTKYCGRKPVVRDLQK